MALDSKYFKEYRQERWEDLPRWKLWLLSATAGTALGLCCVIGLSADKRLSNALLGASGASMGFVTIAAVQSLRKEAPRLITRAEVDRQLMIAQELERLDEPDYPRQSVDIPSGEALGDWGRDQDQGGIQLYDWEDLADENTGIMIAGNAGSGKTTVCCWVLGKLTQQQSAIIEILDPHGGINKIWQELGLNVLTEYWEIEQRFAAAIAELDERRARSKRGEPIGQPYIFVCDELDGCLSEFEDPNVISKAIKRLGKEGRKYDLSLIFISHSANVGAKGIDEQERNCYVNIYLGGSAIAMAKRDYKKHEPERIYLAQQAYPCLVSSGGLPPIPAVHPTHGHHLKFKKKGNAPANLMPINQSPSVQPNEPAERLNALPRIDLGKVERPERPSETWDGSGEIPPSWKAFTVQAIRASMTKTETLEHTLGLKRGGSKIYQAMSSLFDELRGRV